MAFTLTSPAFADGAEIPPQFTCDGNGVSPELTWDDPPEGTRSLVLLLHDPDSTKKPDFTHWLLFDIPVRPGRLVENHGDAVCLPGLNDFGEARYGGPCPAVGEHRYVLDLFALGVDTLGLEMGASRHEVEAAMEGHLLGRANLAARYQKAQSADQ